jgi:hypothetical protein
MIRRLFIIAPALSMSLIGDAGYRGKERCPECGTPISTAAESSE